ncbi:MAG: DNA gyrase subunit A [bacterium]|jgi:DNA gyrase subunit A|nr:DNA gyrase subunit A [bacterium]
MLSDGQHIVNINIEEEMKNSYLDYSMSVIVQRALPDVRDGLKPVHRRILFGMNELGCASNKPYKKSARIVGEVMGKFHPHGDSAIYDTLVRMVQDFSLRYPLIDGQGNFGSIDGDGAAAMRYTESRLDKLAEDVLEDIEKNTVDFLPNYDGSLQEPTVLPSRLPNLLINGSSGIAVGMATNFPPHNLNETAAGIKLLVDHPDATAEDLMKLVKGPDFPTGAFIYGSAGIREAYRTGRGRVVIRARATIESSKGGKDAIVVTEIPYQVNKTRLIEKIVELVRDKKVNGISDIRDESDREGMRLVIELKRDAVAKVVLNQLYKHTQMQSTFGVIMLALVKGQPRVLTLKQVMEQFILHRLEVIVRRTRFDLDKAEARAHILEGLKIALDHIDEVIKLIRASATTEIARDGLMARFALSELQAKAILEMRLQRLTGLERDKLEQELKALRELIFDLKQILADEARQRAIIKEELDDAVARYGDKRRTEIIPDEGEFTIEDMIAEEDVVVTLSDDGFIKRQPVSAFRRQNRGGRGITGSGTKEEDHIEHLFIASTHNHMLFFTENGHCYWLKVHEIPQAGRASKGRAIVNLLEKPRDEKIAAVINVKSFDPERYIVMATENGIIKKTSLEAYSRPRKAGINAIEIREGDRLMNCKLTDGSHEILLGTDEGKAIRFSEKEVRPMGRTASGVIGIQLDDGVKVVGMVVTAKQDAQILVACESGMGKRTSLEEYRATHRGGKGIITVKVTEKTGRMVTMMEVSDENDLMIITERGVMIRQPVDQIRLIGRATQGVKLIRLDEGDKIASIDKVVADREMDAMGIPIGPDDGEELDEGNGEENGVQPDAGEDEAPPAAAEDPDDEE